MFNPFKSKADDLEDAKLLADIRRIEDENWPVGSKEITERYARVERTKVALVAMREASDEALVALSDAFASGMMVREINADVYGPALDREVQKRILRRLIAKGSNC